MISEDDVAQILLLSEPAPPPRHSEQATRTGIQANGLPMLHHDNAPPRQRTPTLREMESGDPHCWHYFSGGQINGGERAQQREYWNPAAQHFAETAIPYYDMIAREPTDWGARPPMHEHHQVRQNLGTADGTVYGSTNYGSLGGGPVVGGARPPMPNQQQSHQNLGSNAHGGTNHGMVGGEPIGEAARRPLFEPNHQAHGGHRQPPDFRQIAPEFNQFVPPPPHFQPPNYHNANQERRPFNPYNLDHSMMRWPYYAGGFNGDNRWNQEHQFHAQNGQREPRRDGMDGGMGPTGMARVVEEPVERARARHQGAAEPVAPGEPVAPVRRRATRKQAGGRRARVKQEEPKDDDEVQVLELPKHRSSAIRSAVVANKVAECQTKKEIQGLLEKFVSEAQKQVKEKKIKGMARTLGQIEKSLRLDGPTPKKETTRKTAPKMKTAPKKTTRQRAPPRTAPPAASGGIQPVTSGRPTNQRAQRTPQATAPPTASREVQPSTSERPSRVAKEAATAKIHVGSLKLRQD